MGREAQGSRVYREVDKRRKRWEIANRATEWSAHLALPFQDLPQDNSRGLAHVQYQGSVYSVQWLTPKQSIRSILAIFNNALRSERSIFLRYWNDNLDGAWNRVQYDTVFSRGWGFRHLPFTFFSLRAEVDVIVGSGSHQSKIFCRSPLCQTLGLSNCRGFSSWTLNGPCSSRVEF